MIYTITDILLFLRRKIYPGFIISRTDKVIDIGSGDKPFWRADVFFDNLELENDQRCTHGNTITNFGLFVHGDIHRMPFKDKAFDFSFCSHVLEHVEHPEQAIQEIMRISKRGYIEVPNGTVDAIHPFSSHLWLIYKDNKKLVFVKKDPRETRALTENGKNFAYLLKKIKNPFIELYWQDAIEYEIIDNTGHNTSYSFPVQKNGEKVKNSSRAYMLFIAMMRKLLLADKDIAIEDLYKK